MRALPSISQESGGIRTVSSSNAEIPIVKTIKRYTTLKDIDNDNGFLYTEFNEGGYAIYDRIGEFLYERSDFGEGPYSNDLNYFNNLPNSKSTFGLPISECGNVYNKYANVHGLKNYRFTTRNGVEQVPENILKGNPCILHLNKLTPEITALPEPNDHAVLCFAFTGKNVLWWYDTYEVYCNFGWQNQYKGSICVNKEFITYNASAEIL